MILSECNITKNILYLEVYSTATYVILHEMRKAAKIQYILGCATFCSPLY
jgi:hypothetical protein